MGNIESVIASGAAPAVLPPHVGEIPTVSNELELCLLGAEATDVIEASSLEIDPEVNKRDIVELLISMQPDAEALNTTLGVHASELVQTVDRLGGSLYAGSSLMRDTSDLEPARYRTTSLSDTLARNLLDITSQQVVIGIGNDAGGKEFGFHLYNTFRRVTPILLGMSASSPCRFSGGQLEYTGTQSRRIDQYVRATQYFPDEILEPPHLRSLEEYFLHLQSISDEVNRRLAAGEMDSVDEELYREREGNPYAPFDRLSPHQVYWMVRPRPDHANADSLMSLEMRVMDAPLRLQRMQAMNSFVLGLSYDMARTGGEDIDAVLSSIDLDDHEAQIIPMLQQVGTYGLQTRIGRRGQTVDQYVRSLAPLAMRGLSSRGLSTRNMVTEIGTLLTHGNDATHVRSLAGQGLSVTQMEQTLSQQFTQSVRHGTT